MSRTNCLRPSKGFCLNLRVRTVNSDIAAAADGRFKQNPLLGRKQFVLDI